MKSALITLAACLAGAPAMAATPSPLGPPPAPGTGLPIGQCIRSHDIRNHSVVDKNTMLMDVNGQAIYRITVRKACLIGVVTTDPIIMQSPPGRNFICSPVDMDVRVTRGGAFPTPCMVDSIVKMSPEEVAALPRGLKP